MLYRSAHLSPIVARSEYSLQRLTSSIMSMALSTTLAEFLPSTVTIFSMATTSGRLGSTLGGNTTEPTAKLSPLEQLRQHNEYWAAKYINNYKFYFLMAVTLIGNSLSLLAVRRRFRTSSSCFYIANLAIWDTLLIWNKGIGVFLTLNDVTVGDVGCKALTYTQNVSNFVSNWTVVAMTVERFLAVTYPLKISRWCTVYRARMTVLAIVIFSALVNSIYLITVVETKGDTSSCDYIRSQKEMMSKIWSWVDVCLYAYLPLMITLVLNISIIKTVSQASRQRATMGGGQQQSDNQRQVTVMLLTVSVTFFVLLTPYSILYVYVNAGFWNYRETYKGWATYLLLFVLFKLLSDTNNCINFFLYVVSGNMFRDELALLFKCSTKSVKGKSKTAYRVPDLKTVKSSMFSSVTMTDSNVNLTKVASISSSTL